MDPVTLRGPRVLLRQWRDDDAAPFAALNADAEVMRHFPSMLDRTTSDAMLTRARTKINERGWGSWALEVESECAGFVGLTQPTFNAHFTPCVEIGWRLARKFWHRGYATEAALLCLRYGFETLKLEQIVSFTTVLNTPSMSVMQRIGMARDPADDFDHPVLPQGHPQRPHVLYRLARDLWMETRNH